MELFTFSIPIFRKGDIQKKLEKLSRKAAKYGNGDIQFTFGEEKIVKRKTEYGEREYRFVDITVSGDAPKIAGWELLARIELLHGNSENLVHHVPGSDSILQEKFREHDGHCEHCKTDRIRNDVYVLTDGEKQIAVGRTCLRDFLGIDDPKSIVSRAQFFEEIRSYEEEDMLGDFGAYGYYDLREILTISASYIRKYGYVSKAKNMETGDEPTSQCVMNAKNGIPGYEIKSTPEDRKWAEKTIEFFRSADTFKNDYMNNIRVIMKEDILAKKHIALVSSAVVAVQRELTPKVELKESNFVGEVKQRLRGLELLLEKIIFLGHGTFGPSYLHLMKDKNGNVFSWITGNKLEIAEGTWLKLDGSVKQHKLYNDVKQTVLTRAKVKEGVS